jgi:hypothetical protein
VNLIAQEKGVVSEPPSFLRATKETNQFRYVPADPSVQAYNSRFFGVAIFGTTAVVKSFLNTPSALTIITPTTRPIFGGALSGTGVWYGLEYIAAGAGNLVTIDTTTGAMTTIGNLPGLAAGHTVTGLSWNKVNSTMYALSTNGTVGTLYTINLSTSALTTIGNTTGSSLPIDMSFNNAGTLYSVDIGTDALNILSTTTGAATPVGPLGVDLNFAQGMCFDPSTDSLFLAAYNSTLSLGQLMRCNTSTGAATLIGNFGSSQTEVDAFVIPGAARPPTPLNAFNLLTPAAGARIETISGSAIPVTITWDTSATGATYKWIFGDPTVPPRRLTIPSTSNSISTTLGALDAILAANGFTNNGSATDSAVGQWNVWAFKGPGATGVDSLVSTNGPRAITLKRQMAGTLSPLDQDFVDPTFPPPQWTLGGGGTMYWTRNAVGGYQTGVGSAKYDYWSATTTTPLQTLTSNQFPPVTSPTNYLRFNYSQAYYLAGATLAPDSCIIETSTNNGTTWTVLIRMGASQTLSSGTNSSPVMSTFASQSAFTPTLATQWATKVFSMPVGTNKVRFVAKSGFGNNLYIDRITSGTMTGVGNTPLTLVPGEYELAQNYPNPFNPSTTINFSLPKQSNVILKIYDVAGKEIRTLLNESRAAGSYEINFDASSLSSGVYFYKIEAADFTDIKRMMLIK